MIQFSKFIFVAALIFLFLSDSLYSLSHQKTFVNNFFIYFFLLFFKRQLVYNTTLFFLCQQIILLFFNFFQKYIFYNPIKQSSAINTLFTKAFFLLSSADFLLIFYFSPNILLYTLSLQRYNILYK